MLGLLYRDFINLKASLRSIILSSIFIMVVAIFFNYGMIMVISLPVFFAFSITGSFQCDAALKWNKKCMTLPISAKKCCIRKISDICYINGYRCIIFLCIWCCLYEYNKFFTNKSSLYFAIRNGDCLTYAIILCFIVFSKYLLL